MAPRCADRQAVTRARGVHPASHEEHAPHGELLIDLEEDKTTRAVVFELAITPEASSSVASACSIRCPHVHHITLVTRSTNPYPGAA